MDFYKSSSRNCHLNTFFVCKTQEVNDYAEVLTGLHQWNDKLSEHNTMPFFFLHELKKYNEKRHHIDMAAILESVLPPLPTPITSHLKLITKLILTTLQK